MARIRTTKPEFWRDAKVLKLSSDAKLLFMASWNFCDDEGRMVYDPEQIKEDVFSKKPEVDIDALTAELTSAQTRMVITYSVDGVTYWQCRNFSKHQKIDKRTPSKFPPPPANSPEFPRVPDTEGKGREGNGKEGIEPQPATAGLSKPSVPPCPHQEIIGLFVKHLPTATAPNPELWAGTRAKHLQARWRESPKRQSLEWWDKFFRYCAESEFLRGDAPPRNGSKPFTLSLDWAVDATNFAKIHEGQYHR